MKFIPHGCAFLLEPGVRGSQLLQGYGIPYEVPGLSKVIKLMSFTLKWLAYREISSVEPRKEDTVL